jgi:hypothetical protein
MPVNPHASTNITVDELTDYSVQAFDSLGKYDVPENIIPVKSSQRDQGKFRVYEPSAFQSDLFQALADCQVAPVATWGHTTAPYSINVYGLRDKVSDRDYVNAEEAIDLFRDTALFLARNGIKQRNKAFADAFLANAAGWSTKVTGVAAGGFTTAPPDGMFNPAENEFLKFTEADSDPLLLLDLLCEVMQETTEIRPDTLIIPRKVMTQLKRNAAINQFGLQNPVGGIAGGEEFTINVIAQYVGLESSRIFVIDTVFNDQSGATIDDATLAELEDGQTGKKITEAAADMKFITESNCLLMHIGDTNLGLRSMSACAEFLWTGLYPKGERGNYKNKMRYDEDGEFTWIEGRQAFKYQITAPALGILIQACI